MHCIALSSRTGAGKKQRGKSNSIGLHASRKGERGRERGERTAVSMRGKLMQPGCAVAKGMRDRRRGGRACILKFRAKNFCRRKSRRWRAWRIYCLSLLHCYVTVQNAAETDGRTSRVSVRIKQPVQISRQTFRDRGDDLPTLRGTKIGSVSVLCKFGALYSAEPWLRRRLSVSPLASYVGS